MGMVVGMIVRYTGSQLCAVTRAWVRGVVRGARVVPLPVPVRIRPTLPSCSPSPPHHPRLGHWALGDGVIEIENRQSSVQPPSMSFGFGLSLVKTTAAPQVRPQCHQFNAEVHSADA